MIGNGPSLKIEDLDRLQGEVSLASNKVFLAFSQTRWRPTALTIADPLVWGKVAGVLHDYVKEVWTPHYLDRRKTRVRVYQWQELTLVRPFEENPGEADFSSDVNTGLYGACTVTFENLQLAVHMGCDPIYIVGCDHSYAGEDKVKRDVPIVVGKEENHFIPGYRQPGEIVNPAPLDIMDLGYEHARLYSDHTGIEILNATRGGRLEAFRRVDFDAIIR